MKRWFASLATMVLAAMLLMALPAVADDPQTKPEPPTVPPAAGDPPGLRGAFKTMDDMLLDVANLVPGFGGMYVDETEEVLYVYSVGRNDAAALRGAIATVFGPDTVPSGGVRVIQGTYTLPQLFGWYQLINQRIFSLEGVTATDLQEAGNHLWIGIADESVRAQVEGEVERLGIPRNAVVIEIHGPAMDTLTLSDAVRPVDAGVQIYNENKGNLCTYGFTVLLNSTLGMVTNSHCSRTLGAVDYDKFHQPSKNSTTNLVGTEMIDPGFFSVTRDYRCPTGQPLCRYSDSAFVQSPGNLTLNRGRIARTTGLGSKTIDPNNPRFRITTTGTALVGNWVNKVGYRTGWTQGQVTRTCYTQQKSSGEYLICQYEASYGRDGGDSGSPVFMAVNASDVKLLGIHWGVNSNGRPVYSPIEGVRLDLAPGGTFKVCDPGFTC